MHEFVFLTGAARREGAPRALYSVLALNSLGYDAAFYSLAQQDPQVTASLKLCKAVVLDDLSSAEDAGSAASTYRGILESGARVVLDLSSPPAGEFYAIALRQAAAVTTGSEHVARASPRPAVVVPEPFHGRAGPPRAIRLPARLKVLQWLAERAGIAQDAWRLRLLWTGEGPIVALAPSLQRLGERIPLTLQCLAPQGAALESLADQLVESNPDELRIAIEAWSPAALAGALDACDVVLLPSPSGLLGAIHGGRCAIARPSPYYGPLAEFAWIGEDITAGITWALSHPEEVLARLARGQEYVNRVHAPEAVARAWLQLFLRIKK